MTNEVTRTAPKKIWLCVSDDECDLNDPYPECYPDDNGVTWSVDQPVSCTVGYVREDEVERLRAELAATRELLEGARRFIDNVAVVANIDAFLRREETSDIGPARGE